MKKVFIIIFVFVLIGLIVFAFSIRKEGGVEEQFITDHNSLYDKSIMYLLSHDTSEDKNKERYHMFTSFHGFGVTEDEEHYYTYMWIEVESFYIRSQKIISSSGSSMAYRFTFNKEDESVITYEIPKDGSEYVSSIRNMFPNSIENTVLKYQHKDTSIKKHVLEFYSDIEDQKIYYADPFVDYQ